MEEIKGTITAEATINGEVATERAIEGRLDVAGIGGGGNVDDVQINGTSIVVDKVANIPYASEGIYGVTTVSGEKVDAIENRVEVLEKMSKGILYDFVTQTVEGNQSIPKGSHLADVQKLEGKSIVWNQLLDIDTVGKANGRYTKKGEGLWEVVFSVTGNYKQLFTSPASVFYPNRKYYIKFKHTNADISYYYPTTAGGSSGITLNTISTVSVETNATLRAMHCEEGQTDTISLQIFDLTQMFGAGNEPTIEQFEQMFPNDYYPYNVGELQSVENSKITVRGRNLFDFDTWAISIGAIKEADGYFSHTNVSNLKIWKNTNKIAGPISLNYNIKNATSQRQLFFSYVYTDGTKFNAYPWGSGQSVANVSDANKIVDYIQISYGEAGVWYAKDVSICAGSERTYSPYHEPTEIPLAFAGKSAGTVRDELDLVNKKYIQRVGVVDLGSLNYNKIDTYFYTTQLSHLIKLVYSSLNLMCSIYTADTYSNVNTIDMTVGQSNNGYVKLHNDKYSDAQSFKSAMQGVMLYYELAEPIITDVSTVIDSFEVEGNGTIEFDSSIPVKNTIEYLRYLNEV